MMDTLEFWAIIALLGGYVFNIYKSFTNPDIKASKEIAEIKTKCELKHQYIDENLVLIKENHLRHIESTLSDINNRLIRIETKLEK